jgi:magnesium transporter
MPEPNLPLDEIRELIDQGNWDRLQAALPGLHPADIADIIELAPRDRQARIFLLLDDDVKPDVLAELENDSESKILDTLSPAQISDIVEDMSPDDAADLLGDLPQSQSEAILDLMEKDDSDDVRKLLSYAEDTAGGIMTTEVVAMRGDQSVQDAIHAIAHIELEEGEPFVFAYIVDHIGRLTGYVDIWTLLRQKNRNRLLSEVCQADPVAVNVNTDQEDVARTILQYSLSAIPVVDELGCLVGRITADDVMDVVQEEASEDILRMAGTDDAELDSVSPFRSCLIRLPWLLITLGGGFITSLILRQFHAQLGQIVILAAFVPVVLAMGGNTGIQASTLMVRTIAIHGSNRSGLSRTLLREVAVGAMMGTLCGLAIGLWVYFMSRHAGLPPGSIAPVQISAIVATALFSAMTFAAVFGALVPVLLDRIHIDPAVAAGPFVTITNDISALLIYFGVTVTLVRHFAS